MKRKEMHIPFSVYICVPLLVCQCRCRGGCVSSRSLVFAAAASGVHTFPVIHFGTRLAVERRSLYGAVVTFAFLLDALYVRYTYICVTLCTRFLFFFRLYIYICIHNIYIYYIYIHEVFVIVRERIGVCRLYFSHSAKVD